MYFLLIEIPGLKQFERIEVPMIENLRREITALLAYSNGETVHDEGDFLLIRLDIPMDDVHQRALKGALQCLALLNASARESLLGYTLLLDISEESPRVVFHNLRAALFGLRTTEALWVGAPIWTQIDSHAQEQTSEEVDGDYHRMSEYVVQNRRRDMERFVVIERVVEQILAALDTWLYGEADPGVLHLCGTYHTGVIYNLEAALLKLFGGLYGWLSLKPAPTSSVNPLSPFVYSLDYAWLRETPDYLTTIERTLWERDASLLHECIKNPAHRRIQDRFERRFLAVYKLYFMAALRRMRTQLLPPVVVIEEVDRISEESFVLLKELMHGLAADICPMICVTSVRQMPANRSALKVNQIIRMPRRNFDEMRALLAELPAPDTGAKKPTIDDLWNHTHGYTMALYHYWIVATGCTQPPTQPPAEPSKNFDLQAELETLIACLTEHERTTLFCAALMGQIVTADTLSEILATVGFDRHAAPVVVQRLTQLGLLRDTLFCIPIAPGLETIMKSRYSEQFTELKVKVADWCWQAWQQKRLAMTMEILQIIEGGRDVAKSLEALFCVLDNLLNVRDLSGAERVLYGDIPLLHWIRGPEEIRTLQIILFVHRMRLMSKLGDLKRMKQIYARRRDLLDSGFYEGYMHLECARYEFVCGKLERAIALNKRAIVHFQKQDDSTGIDRAHIDFGHYLLVRAQIKSAIQHFALACSSGAEMPVGFDSIRAAVMQSVAHFLYGNYSAVSEQTQVVVEGIYHSALIDWALYAGFLRARAHFELGSYRKASEQFAYMMSIARTADCMDAFWLNRIWLNRTLIYRGAAAQVPGAFVEMKPTREVLFFLGEAYERLNEYDRAVECLDRAMRLPPDAPSNSLEAIDWSGGFRSCEDRIQSGANEDVLTNLISALYGFIRARHGESTAGAEALHTLTSVRNLSPEDPYNAYYLYLYSQILADMKRNEESTTIMSRAIKFSQERTGRIEHYGDRYAFQHDNYWNRKLIDSAHAHNLL